MKNINSNDPDTKEEELGPFSTISKGYPVHWHSSSACKKSWMHYAPENFKMWS